jgi:hypothetical protein
MRKQLIILHVAFGGSHFADAVALDHPDDLSLGHQNPEEEL